MEDFLKGKLEELVKERAEYGRRKAEALGRIASLGQQLANNEILIDNYSTEVSELNERIGRCEKTIAYYDKCSEDIERQLEDEQNAARRAKTAKQAVPLIIAAMILLATFGIFLASEGTITGFFTRETVTAYEQTLSINASQAQTYSWQPENAGELRSVAISGKLLGEGTAKVYLEKDGTRYLILDSAALAEKTKSLTSITGLAVAEPGTSEAAAENTTTAMENTTAVNIIEAITTTAENITEVSNATADAPADENVTAPVENATENATSPIEAAPENTTIAEKAISISLQYNAGTPFDEDNDGIEFNTSAIDFTVKGSEFSWPASEDKLCTQWIVQPDSSDTVTQLCYGSVECCALLELAPESSGWNDEFALVVGLYRAEENNTISSRVIYANYSLEQGDVYSEIVYSNFSSLPARFIPEPESGKIEAVQNITAIEFNRVCADTCVLPWLNETSYTLIIEVENATLEISSIAYTIATREEIDAKPPVVTIISPRIRAYNTTLIELNFSIDEEADRIWFVLNNGSNVTITTNTTIAAANGTNTLALHATDIAGNKGSDEVIFSVMLPEAANATITNVTNITANATLNMTPKLNALRKDYKQSEDAEFEFEFIQKSELVKGGKWKDEYEGYEDDYEDFLETVSAAKKVDVENAVAAEKAKTKRKGVDKLVATNETVSAQVFDSEGRKAEASAEIEELREGKFRIKLPKQRAFKAGLYTLVINLTKDGTQYVEEQNFTWGVLAINVNKSIYLPSEDAFIAMAVLNNEGHMVCDAGVSLAITDPAGATTAMTTSNGKINISPECQVYGVTNLPDYYTTYAVNGVGTYMMNLTAVTANGIRSITDNFTVQSQVDFDVSRNGPTRIYPPVPYVMNLTINVNRNYNGQIIEYVPASFTIKPQEGLTITTIADAKALSWDVNLKRGDTTSLYYEFDAPDTSPEFYLLGELGIGNWQETRQWQIASDAPAKITDDSFSCDLSIIAVGGTTACTGQYDNVGDPFATTCTLVIQLEGTTSLSNSCGANNLRVSAIDVSGASGASCSDNGDGTVNCVNWPSAADNQVIIWTLEGCAASSGNTADTYTACTNQLNNNAGDIVVLSPPDTTPPNNSIIVPLQNTNVSGNLFINASVNESAGTVEKVNVTLYNNTGNATGLIPMSLGAGNRSQGYWNATIDTATLVPIDGKYNISVNATDNLGNINISTVNVSITIDNTKANVSIVTPLNNTNATGNMLINASVNDTTSGIFNATFRLTSTDGSTTTDWIYAQRVTGTISQGYWNATADTTTIPSGNYNITINATDYAGNQLLANISQITIDNTAPNNSIIVPLQNTNVSGNLFINASVNESAGTVEKVNVTLYNNTGNATGLIPMSLGAGNRSQGYWNATIDTATLVPIDGKYNISVNATDNLGNINISAVNVSITIDNTKANVSSTSPANLTNFTSQDILINASVNDTLTKVFNVTFKLYNSSTNATQWIDASIGQGNYDQGVWNATISSSTLVSGYYNVTINATDYAGNQFVRNISSFNVSAAEEASAPVVYNVTPAVVTPVAGSYTANLVIVFNVSDADGAADLDNTKARVNVTQLVPGVGFINRTNTSGNCEVITSSFNSGLHRTYSCIVPIRYHDNASSKWQINATISDSTNRVAGNYSQNATINSLSAFSIYNANLALTGSIGSANNELSFIINNTGNFNFTSLNLTPYDLNASLTDFFKLGGETTDTRGSANFSFNTSSSASGFGIGLTNATPINISNNYEAGSGGSPVAFGVATGHDTDISQSNKTFYIYIDIPLGKGLSSGVTYNASPALPWEIIAQ